MLNYKKVRLEKSSNFMQGCQQPDIFPNENTIHEVLLNVNMVVQAILQPNLESS